MKAKNLETKIQIKVQTFAVWCYALRHCGKDDDGTYIADGLRWWNPISWVIVAVIFLIGLFVEVWVYTFDFFKEIKTMF